MQDIAWPTSQLFVERCLLKDCDVWTRDLSGSFRFVQPEYQHTCQLVRLRPWYSIPILVWNATIVFCCHPQTAPPYLYLLSQLLAHFVQGWCKSHAQWGVIWHCRVSTSAGPTAPLQVHIRQSVFSTGYHTPVILDIDRHIRHNLQLHTAVSASFCSLIPVREGF